MLSVILFVVLPSYSTTEFGRSTRDRVPLPLQNSEPSHTQRNILLILGGWSRLTSGTKVRMIMYRKDVNITYGVPSRVYGQKVKCLSTTESSPRPIEGWRVLPRGVRETEVVSVGRPVTCSPKGSSTRSGLRNGTGRPLLYIPRYVSLPRQKTTRQLDGKRPS